MKFKDLFPQPKPIIGMIHLAGRNLNDIVYRALEELWIYSEEGLSGAIIENYHGTIEDVEWTLRYIKGRRLNGLKIGVNTLGRSYSAFRLAKKYDAHFVQLDSIQETDLDPRTHEEALKAYPELVLLGGIGFKYTRPTGRPLAEDLESAVKRGHAIVTTGSGTGIETPMQKLRDYKEILKTYEVPLIIGAGVTRDKVVEQLSIADGAIIGSYFKKDNNTNLEVVRTKVRGLVREVELSKIRGNSL